MYGQILEIENQLREHLSSPVRRRLYRSETDDSVMLSANTQYELSILLSCDCICVSYADEQQYFHYSDSEDISDIIELIGIFINELMTGTLVYERIFYGHVQTKCRVTLINRISRHTVHLRDTVTASRHAKNAPRLVLHEKVSFI